MQIEVAEFEEDLPFHGWRRNVHSQCGEDGIIENLLGLIGGPKGYFVEFGAWDGRHLSNSAKLADEGWAGCFIEGDVTKFVDLKTQYASRPDIATVNALVGVAGENSLDEILKRHGAPAEVTVLSIDIDGMDYHVWDALQQFKSTVCVVEFNPTIPAHVSFVQDMDPAIQQGASLRALTGLAAKKGYALVAATDWNGIFVLEQVCRDRKIPTYTPEQVKIRRYETYLFHGYDGTMMTAGYQNLLWHDIQFGADDFQILPSKLRKLPAGVSQDYLAALGKFRDKRAKAKVPGGFFSRGTAKAR